MDIMILDDTTLAILRTINVAKEEVSTAWYIETLKSKLDTASISKLFRLNKLYTDIKRMKLTISDFDKEYYSKVKKSIRFEIFNNMLFIIVDNEVVNNFNRTQILVIYEAIFGLAVTRNLDVNLGSLATRLIGIYASILNTV